MHLILYFTVSLSLSFAGSVPIGLITLTITQQTLKKGRQSGLGIAFGATIMEFIYPAMVLLGLDFFKVNIVTSSYLKMFATAIFTMLAVLFFSKKQTSFSRSGTPQPGTDFMLGLLVGSMNVLIIPFWVFMAIWLETNGMPFHNHVDILIFFFFSACGAFLAFVGYILMSELVLKRVKEIDRYVNVALGLICAVLALYQLSTLV